MNKEEAGIEIEESETESETESESGSDNDSVVNDNKTKLNKDIDFGSDVEEDDDDDDEEDAEEDDEEGDLGIFKNKDDVVNNMFKNTQNIINRDDFSDDEDDDDEDIDENYLQKLDNGVKNNIISEHHPELMVHNMDEVEAACVIVRDSNGVIVDRMHKTLPFVTRYEKARVLGERAKQINAGAKPFIEISDSLIDGYLIALKEFEQKKIPFIVRRPLPNGGSEYWKLRDLEILE